MSNEFILLSLAISEDGIINQSLQFSVGSKKLESAGADKTEIEEFKLRLVKEIKTFRDEFYLSFLLQYASNPQPEFQIGKALVVTEPTYTTKTDTIGFNLLFSSLEAWNFFHKTSGDGATNSEQTNYGFMITSGQSSLFPFSALQNDLMVGQRYAGAYKNALGNIKLDYNPDLVYDYATFSRSIKSDSNYAVDSELYHHIWIKKIDELENAKIKLYLSVPNAPLWYLALLGTVAAGMAIALIAIKSRQKSKFYNFLL